MTEEETANLKQQSACTNCKTDQQDADARSATELQPTLMKFGRFHAAICGLGFLTMVYATLITLSGMFLNLLPYNCSDGVNGSFLEADQIDNDEFLSSISQQYGLCQRQTGDLTNVAFFAGTIVGSLLGGPASDAIGRARCSLIGQALLVLASLASNYAPNLALHLAARCVAGCCLMPAQCAMQVYGCELHSDSHRSRFIAAWSTGISVGTLAAGGLAWATRHHQLYVLFSCCTAAPSLLLLGVCLPESPVWLAARGRHAAAEAALRRIALINGETVPSRTAASAAIEAVVAAPL
ncbi:hypothetical protein BOX15_Mlig031425g1 [Macrostomum lignano]|uniref:Major facilitator superfamily (MFS) profile domain-containing protein n=1 Tax=Macrostomum lignano TaxID=282301 RepID=A0A267E921_9PLAT|nr:hypothetical protein BOX15_Mlig031425g1 [Macrostomum lignano]